MTKNIGLTDSIVRLIIAVAIAALYYTNVITGALSAVLLIVMGMLVITSIVGTCPLYSILRINTRK